MSTVDESVTLLAPEEETVAEHAIHQRIVDLLWAGFVARYAGRDDVAVHARLAWFPDRADTRVRLDPDVLIAFGRPPAPRSSYRTWDEDGVAPTVLVEVWSDGDTDRGYRQRLARARRHGVEEVVLIDPFAPGGVRVEHLVADPDDPSRFRTAAVSAAGGDAIAIRRLGITACGGPELVVADEHGRWPDTATALTEARIQRARAERLEQRLRAAGLPLD